MQLKMVVLPAPFGPMSPTISNSPTRRLTSCSAWRLPKRIETSVVSRTDIDALRSPAAATSGSERLALQPPPDGCGEGAEAVRLEDEREDGQHARERLDEEPGALLDVGDPEVLGELGQPVACEHEQQGEDHDAPAPAQAANDRDDEERQGDLGEGEVRGHHVEAPRPEQGAGDARVEPGDREGEQG